MRSKPPIGDLVRRNFLPHHDPTMISGSCHIIWFAGLYCLAPQVLDALKILKPETVIRWHRPGFRAYWRWKSRPPGGRPGTPYEIRELIRDMSIANALWWHRVFTVSSSRSASMSDKPRSPNIR